MKNQMSAKRMLQVLLFQQSYSPSQQEPGPGATIFISLNRSYLLLKTLLFLSIFILRYSLCFSWISLMMSSSSQSSCSLMSLNLAYPTPKPGFFMIRSGSSSYSLMILVAMSLAIMLQLPTGGAFFLSSMNFLQNLDLKAELTSFSSEMTMGLQAPGPGLSYSQGSLLLASVEPNCPRQPRWILQMSLSSIVFLGQYDPGPGILTLLLIREGHLSSSAFILIFLFALVFLPNLRPISQLSGPRLKLAGSLSPPSKRLLDPKLVEVLPALGFETCDISRQDPGPGVVSSISSYQLSSSESNLVEGGAFYDSILLST